MIDAFACKFSAKNISISWIIIISMPPLCVFYFFLMKENKRDEKAEVLYHNLMIV